MWGKKLEREGKTNYSQKEVEREYVDRGGTRVDKANAGIERGFARICAKWRS